MLGVSSDVLVTSVNERRVRLVQHLGKAGWRPICEAQMRMDDVNPILHDLKVTVV